MDQLTKAEKVSKLFELQTEGKSIHIASKECGISIATARKMMSDYLEAFPAKAVHAYRQRCVEIVQDQIEKALIRQDKKHMLVNAGKIVRMDTFDPATGGAMVDPVTGGFKQGEILEDTAPAREEGAFVIRAVERMSRLLGLDSAPLPVAPPAAAAPPIAVGDNERLVAAIRAAMEQTNMRIRSADASDATVEKEKTL